MEENSFNQCQSLYWNLLKMINNGRSRAFPEHYLLMWDYTSQCDNFVDFRLERQAINQWVNSNDTMEHMSHVKTPITFILSTNDTMLKYDVQSTMIKNYAKSNTITLNNTGHAAFYQQPEKMCKIISQ